MNHVAVDLGSKQSHICIRKPDGTIEKSVRVKNQALPEFFEQLEKSHIVVEACSEAFTVARWAKAHEHSVTVVPSILAPALGVGARGVKTDKRDAENLSMASCRMAKLPSVHIPSTFAQQLRQQLAARTLLVQTRTMVTNHFRGYLRQELLSVKSGDTETMAARVRELLLARPAGMPEHLEQLAKTHESLCEQIQAADDELAAVVKADAVCLRLMTVPGVGPVTSGAFRSAIDEVERFQNPHLVQSYLGLTPKEHSSGETERRGGISKAGPAMLRAALVQAAWSAWRTAPHDPMVVWAKNLAVRRPKQVAIVALARKLAGILFALWRDESEYSPQHSSLQK
jgi:transposase